MNRKERSIILLVLFSVVAMVAFDLSTDSREGVVIWHVLSEGFVGILAVFGIFFLWRGSVELKHRLAKEMNDFSEFKKEAEAWRTDSRKYVDGLSLAIDQQLSKWNLTVAEKEVAFLLLKGLSLKEVANVRATSEKTARVQAIAIYAKSGLSGRSELSAFFLEDLLLPQK